MARTSEKFEPIEGLDGVFCARRGTLRCTAIRLADGSICLYSPVAGLAETARASFDSIGKVEFLLAPNHYHHMALEEYVGVFSSARLVAPPAAIPRLQKMTGLAPDNLDGLLDLLPPTVTIVHPEGLKTGEIWLRFKGATQTVWLVVDAICTKKENAKQPVSNTPELPGTFPSFGIRDKELYRDWLLKQIELDQPGMVIPCHGSLIVADDLPVKLRGLSEQF